MKNILIIGGSTGIGLETAKILSKEHNVYATYNNTAVVDANNINYQFYNVAENNDLDLPEEIHGIIYCPGSITLKPFKRLKSENLLEDFNLHVGGAVNVIQQALPKLSKEGNNSIVLFSSVAVQTGFNFHTQISICKGALEGLTKALSAELAPTTRVNAIAPSLTNTPLASALLNSDAKIKANADRHPLKRIGEAKDIAEMASFLVSDKASWITGQILKVDGGISNIKG